MRGAVPATPVRKSAAFTPIAAATVMLAVVMLAAVVACTAQLSAQDAQRINELYTHTQIMLQLTSPQDAQAIGLHPAAFVPTNDTAQRLDVMEATLGLSPGKRTIAERISAAEARMSEMMVAWQKLQPET